MSSKRTRGQPSSLFEPHRRSMALRDWPAADRKAWEAATAPAGFLTPGGAASHLRPATQEILRHTYGRFLAVLSCFDDLDPTETPARRITPARTTRFIGSLRRHLSDCSIRGDTRNLFGAIRVMEPSTDWAWILQHPDRPSAEAARLAKRKKEIFDPQELFDIAIAAMEAADAKPANLYASIHYRDGLLVAFLCDRSLRRGNLCRMQLGRHFIRVGERFLITFKPEETKNKMPYEAFLSDRLAPYMQLFLDVHRPRIMRKAEHDFLWPRLNGQELQEGGMATLLRAIGRRYIGRPLTVHAFRHAAASFALESDPRLLEVASGLLGHRSSRITQKYYDHSSRSAGVLEWQKLQSRIRGFK